MPIEKQVLDDQTLQTITEGKIVDGTTPVIDKEVHEKAVGAQKSLDGLLAKHGFESVDDVIDALESGGALAAKLGERDLDRIIKAADTLEGYEAHWAAEEVKTHRASETEDDRISRVESELKAFKDEKAKEEADARRSKESQEALDVYEAAVAVTAKESEITEGQVPFFREFMGLDNPMIDVDLDDKAAVRKAMKDQTKKYNDFVQKTIKSYTDGKIKLVDIKPTEPIVPDKVEAKNLKESRKIAKEKFLGFFNKS